jgi:hypothetical protein
LLWSKKDDAFLDLLSFLRTLLPEVSSVAKNKVLRRKFGPLEAEVTERKIDFLGQEMHDLHLT